MSNLLSQRKGLQAFSINKDLDKREIFTLNDFIANYSKIAIKKLFSNKVFGQNEFNELNKIYLYFIFQIKDSENLIKLKIMIYTYLYEKNDINDFIKNSSIEIFSKDKQDNLKLRGYELKYNEFNINIYKIPHNTGSFFGKDLHKDISVLLDFFNHKKITSNDFYKNNEKKTITENQIVIDDIHYKENKIHLFSTEFLIMNGLKPKIQECDFEIFNDNNYSVDLFAKFLRKIIIELNNSIRENNFKNDFMEKHLLKFHKHTFSHFISAKFGYTDKKEESSEIKDENKNKNPFIKISIYQEENKCLNEKKNKDIESSSEKSDIASVFSDNSMKELLKKQSDEFEDLVNKILTKNFEEGNLISLPNILFFLNFKIPIFNKNNNSIDFKSAHLDYSKNTILYNEKYMYGFKEIDAVFKSKINKYIEVGYLQYFYNNLKYIKDKNDKEFKEVKGNNFSIFPNSIFFCEIKHPFPNMTHGREKFIPVQISNLKKSENNEINYINDELSPYKAQLKKLIKKFIFFFEIFKEYTTLTNIQIVFLYDSMDVDKVITDKKKLNDATENILKDFCYTFQNGEKIIFQLIFFDLNKHNMELEEAIKNKDIIIDKQKQVIDNQKKVIDNQKFKEEKMKNELRKMLEEKLSDEEKKKIIRELLDNY